MSAALPPADIDRARLMKRATYAATGVALILIVVKLLAWGATGSVALLSTLVDSVLDAGASMVNLVAVRHALLPADREHRFGHGKAEPLAGLGQAAFIAGSAMFLVIEAVGRLFDPVGVERGEVGIAVMLFAIVLTFALVAFQKHVIRRTGSVAITADSLHYSGDVMINASVIVSILAVTLFGWPYADPLFALAIAVYLLHSAWTVAIRSMHLLMDREFPEEDRCRIKDIALAHPAVQSVHELRTRSSGHASFIQMHMVVDGDMSLRAAHAIADSVEAQIRDAFPHAEVIIHEDPAGLAEDHPRYL